MTNLLSRYFRLGKGQRITAQSCGVFWAKISVFDAKTRFNYVKTKEK